MFVLVSPIKNKNRDKYACIHMCVFIFRAYMATWHYEHTGLQIYFMNNHFNIWSYLDRLAVIFYFTFSMNKTSKSFWK